MRGRILLVAAAAAMAGSLVGLPQAAQAKGTIVRAPGNYDSGTILVRTGERRLYFMIGGGQAIAYPVGVGRAGKQWSGTSHIDAKYHMPAWEPPAAVRKDKPGLPKVIASGSPRNPLGVAAMSIAGGEYAIHGTNQPSSIGHFVSYGCIRMYNQDISDLIERASVGATVVVQ